MSYIRTVSVFMKVGHMDTFGKSWCWMTKTTKENLSFMLCFNWGAWWMIGSVGGNICFFFYMCLPVFKVCLQVTARHTEGADWRQRTGHGQLVQQLVNQYAGPAAGLQLQSRPVQWTEVPLLQEATQTAGTESVSTGCIQWLHQWLQANVAHQVVIHLQPVVVEVVLSAAVDLTTLGTQRFQGWLHRPGESHLTAWAAHLYSFDAAQLWH